MLTARSAETDKVLGLELGADDYVTKPFSITELLARVRAVLRRTGQQKPTADAIRIGDIEIDFKLHQARRGKARIEFTAREFDLLRYFVQHTGQVVTREQILNEVWGYEEFPTTRTIDNFVAKLRQKIERSPHAPGTHPHDSRLRDISSSGRIARTMEPKNILILLLIVIAIAFHAFWYITERRRRHAGHAQADAGWRSASRSSRTSSIPSASGPSRPRPRCRSCGSVMPDEKIPGTLNVGYVMATVVQAVIFMTIIEVDFMTLDQHHRRGGARRVPGRGRGLRVSTGGRCRWAWASRCWSRRR